jgi:hypothetical protein
MNMSIEDSEHMAIHLTIPFPTERSELQRQLAAERQWMPARCLLAVGDALAAAEALSQAGTVREAQLKYHEDLEEEWRRRMKEFIKRHALP